MTSQLESMPEVDAYVDALLAPAAPVAAPAPSTATAPLPATTLAARSPVSVAAVPEPVAIDLPIGRWLRVSVDQDHYAFELLRVQEVARMLPIVAMRGTSEAMLGVANLRGAIVPVVDLGRWLNAGEVRPDERTRIVVIERNDELLGVLVSAVDDVVTLQGEVERVAAIGGQARRAIDRAFIGIARPNHAPTVLLDANAFFG